MADLASLSIHLPEADCLLVVPPAARLNWPSLGVHQLQACAREAGFEVAILYLNVLYGALVGAKPYEAISIAPTDWLLGERLFARVAFGAPPLGFASDRFLAVVAAANEVWTGTVTQERPSEHTHEEEGEPRILREDLLAWEAHAFALVEWVAPRIAERHYPVVGATSHFDQTAASLAVLSRVKALQPQTRLIMGGANCEAEMAMGIHSLSSDLDHVFSGESEETFVRFLRDVRAGRDPGPPIIQGAPCTDLDALPTPRFEEYFAQVGSQPALADSELWVEYETSRGCWWGQKHHCTFCGFNALGMDFREKSADRVLEQLGEILASAPTRRIQMTDNIMPYRFHQTLIPRIPQEIGEVRIWYEMKANLSLSQVKNLGDTGEMTIQAGIEALDTELTRLTRKGILARQNVALLRYARIVGMKVQWNLLWGLPGDTEQPYRRTLDLLPKLRHLGPPYMLTHLILDRYSPYQLEPDTFGITDLQPLDCYADAFPSHADLERLAYHFQGTYQSGSHDALPLMAAINQEIERWHLAWRGDPRKWPTLMVSRAGPGRYVLVDTRGLGKAPTLYLNDAQARAVLVGGPRERVGAAEWAIENTYAADLDGWCAPLAVAPYALLTDFEARSADAVEAGRHIQVISL
ncbi:MAG: RiPP maturation radical SAM C-methyltransferase [Deltaproteobacteria bacterium]|nr:RiPP maturation radical SAM C-methyltransferase [Deltaproteobacteria bacterium]